MSKLPEDVDALVRLSLEIGLEKFCERVIEAHSQGVEEGRKLEREKTIAALESIAEQHNWGKDSLVTEALNRLKSIHQSLNNQSEEKNE